MDRDHSNEIRRINYLISEMEGLYHQASRKLGISDSVSMVLYAIYEEGDACLLRDVYKKTGISKQTVNSAIRRLEAAQILCLERCGGRAKKLVLTPKGQALVRQTVARLFQAEAQAFDTWPDEEIAAYLHLVEKYAQCLRRQIELL